MKTREKKRLKEAIRENTRAPLARPPSPDAEGGETRIPLPPYRHFERSEKSSLHTGKAKTVR